MMLSFKSLNIPVVPGKTQGPATVLEFMGIILDSVGMEARLPGDKIERLRVVFDIFHKCRSCTLKELQSLIGSLNFACKVISPVTKLNASVLPLIYFTKGGHVP
jgi:hypothetical protein